MSTPKTIDFPSMLRRFFLLALLAVALPVGAAQIEARTSHDAVPVGQPFYLFLEARGEVASPPDLSALQGAFEILGRSQRRNVQIINGRSIQNASLTLTLRPKSPGKLTIPSISFGEDRSQPIEIEVTGGYQGPPEEWQATRVPQPSTVYSPAPPVPEETTVSPSRPVTTPPQTAAASNIWPWVAFFLALGWALTIGLWVASRRRSVQETSRPLAKEQPQPSTVHTPLSPLDLALRHLEDARSRRDPERTKSALLDWARHLWPEDPPSSLRSLAQRCPPDVGPGILEFERALYSPVTEPWFDRPVWQRLAEMTEQMGDKAA